MTPSSLDTTARVSPLELLLPPPSRERSGDGSFAQHLQNAPPPKLADSSRQRESTERQQRTADAPAATASTPPTAKTPDRPAAVEEENETTSAADSQGDPQTPHEPVVSEVTADVQAEELVEEEDEPEEESAQDELLLTCLAPPTSDPAPTKLPAEEEAITEESAAEIADIAPDKVGKSSKPATVKTQAAVGTPAPESPVVVDTNPEVTADATAHAKVATSTDAPATEAVAIDPTQQAVEQVDDIALVADEQAIENEKPARGEAKRGKTKATSDDVEVTTADTTVEAAVPEETSESEQLAAIGSREPKRSRQRTEARGNTNGEPAHAPPGVQPAPATAVDAVSATATATTTQPTTEAPSTRDLALPPPVAGAANTPPSEAGAPQSLQRLPQHLLARSTARGSAGAPPNPAEQARFVTRVAKAFQTAQARGGELQLRLSPAELGSLKLEIKLKDGVLSARVEAESANAKAMLMDNLPVLKERLAEQGIVVEKFDVELMDRQPQGQPDTAHERERRHAPRAPYATKTEDAAATPPAPGEPRSLRGDGRLNVTA